MACAVLLLGVGATLARAAPMVWTMDAECMLSSPKPLAMLKDCVKTTGADRVEGSVNRPDTKVGEWIDGAVGADGKVVCQRPTYALSESGSVTQ